MLKKLENIIKITLKSWIEIILQNKMCYFVKKKIIITNKIIIIIKVNNSEREVS